MSHENCALRMNECFSRISTDGPAIIPNEINFISNLGRGGKIPERYGKKSTWQKKYTHAPNFFQLKDIFSIDCPKPIPIFRELCGVECP